MLFALGAASSLLDGLQSLTSSASSTSSAGQSQFPFSLLAGTTGLGTSSATSGGGQIAPQTMSALIDAQSQSGSTTAASLSPSQALQDLFSQIDSNGDGQITSADASGGTSGSNPDPLMQALDGASSSSVTNGDGSTTTTITYADGSKVTMTSPAASTSTSSTTSNSAASSYNWIEQMIQRQAQAMAAQAGSSLSISA